jgi:hypothetical protein
MILFMHDSSLQLLHLIFQQVLGRHLSWRRRAEGAK